MPTEDAYSSGHLVLSHFGTCKCSNVETNLSWTCLISGLLSFEHPSVLLFLLSNKTDGFFCCLSLSGASIHTIFTNVAWMIIARSVNKVQSFIVLQWGSFGLLKLFCYFVQWNYTYRQKLSNTTRKYNDKTGIPP